MEKYRQTSQACRPIPYWRRLSFPGHLCWCLHHHLQSALQMLLLLCWSIRFHWDRLGGLASQSVHPTDLQKTDHSWWCLHRRKKCAWLTQLITVYYCSTLSFQSLTHWTLPTSRASCQAYDVWGACFSLNWLKVEMKTICSSTHIPCKYCFPEVPTYHASGASQWYPHTMQVGLCYGTHIPCKWCFPVVFTYQQVVLPSGTHIPCRWSFPAVPTYHASGISQWYPYTIQVVLCHGTHITCMLCFPLVPHTMRVLLPDS